jgi:hypothetical protein
VVWQADASAGHELCCSLAICVQSVAMDSRQPARHRPCTRCEAFLLTKRHHLIYSLRDGHAVALFGLSTPPSANFSSNPRASKSIVSWFPYDIINMNQQHSAARRPPPPPPLPRAPLPPRVPPPPPLPRVPPSAASPSLILTRHDILHITLRRDSTAAAVSIPPPPPAIRHRASRTQHQQTACECPAACRDNDVSPPCLLLVSWAVGG